MFAQCPASIPRRGELSCCLPVGNGRLCNWMIQGRDYGMNNETEIAPSNLNGI